MTRSSGISLGSTLLVAALAVTLAFMVAGLGVNHLNVVNRVNNVQTARNLAEAVVFRALEQNIYSSYDFGSHGSETMAVTFPNVTNADGFLAFDPAAASAANVLPCTYNLAHTTATTSSTGRMVPAESLYLVGRGRCNGVERHLEVIVAIPTYTAAIASEGPVNASGAMLVAGARNVTDALPVTSSNPNLTPSHLVSNGSGDHSVNLTSSEGDVFIKGYARSTGGISKDSNDHVTVSLGERPGSERVTIPSINIADFDPASFTDPSRLQTVPSDGVVRQGGLFRYHGELTLDRLDMPSSGEGAVVFVQGNLTINQGMSGTGLVVATGNVVVRGAGNSDVTSPNLAAVIAGRSADLQGNDPAFSIYRGFVYANEQARVKNATVFGPVVKAGDASNGVNLENSNLVNIEEVLQFKFSMPFQAGNGVAGVDVRLANGVKLQDFYNPATGHYDRQVRANHLDYYDVPGHAYFPTLAAAASHALSQPASAWPPGLAGYPGSTNQEKMEYYFSQVAVPEAVTNLNQDLVKIDAWYQAHLGQPKDSGSITMNPTAFLPLDRRMRVVLWREY